MIISISRGEDPAGLIGYLLGSAEAMRDGARLVGFEQLASFETAPKEMAYTASLSDRVRNYVLHISVSPAPGETLSDTQWERVWDAIDDELGLHGHQSITVAHDEGRQHRHRGYNIIHPDTKRTPPDMLPPVSSSLGDNQPSMGTRKVRRAWDSNIKFRLQRLSRELEITLGLFSAIQPERWRSRKTENHSSPATTRHEQRTGLLPIEREYGDAIRKALSKNGWAERTAELNMLGIGAELYSGRNKRRKGITFYVLDKPERRCSGSALGSDYGLGALERRAGETFAAFLERTPSGVAAVTPTKPPVADILYQRYVAYKAEHRDAVAAFRLRIRIAKAEHRLAIDQEVRRQIAMRSAMRAAAERWQRKGITDRTRAVDNWAIAQMKAAQKVKLQRRFPSPPPLLGWRDWLARSASG